VHPARAAKAAERPIGKSGAKSRASSRDEKLFILATKNKQTNHKQPSKGQVTNMQDKKKKTKKGVKVDDLKPARDPKGGMPQGSLEDPKWILKHLQLGQGPGGGGKTGPNSPL
jgi:hypothetical protein